MADEWDGDESDPEFQRLLQVERRKVAGSGVGWIVFGVALFALAWFAQTVAESSRHTAYLMCRSDQVSSALAGGAVADCSPGSGLLPLVLILGGAGVAVLLYGIIRRATYRP